jgi:hypothetical protein
MMVHDCHVFAGRRCREMFKTGGESRPLRFIQPRRQLCAEAERRLSIAVNASRAFRDNCHANAQRFQKI